MWKRCDVMRLPEPKEQLFVHLNKFSTRKLCWKHDNIEAVVITVPFSIDHRDSSFDKQRSHGVSTDHTKHMDLGQLHLSCKYSSPLTVSLANQIFFLLSIHSTLVLSLQEIYPPKVSEFAYVTDGACTVANILDTELIICKVRLWNENTLILP